MKAFLSARAPLLNVVSFALFAAGLLTGLLLPALFDKGARLSAGGLTVAQSAALQGAMFRADIDLNFLRGNEFKGIEKSAAIALADSFWWMHRIQLYPDYVTKGQWEEDRGFNIPLNLTGQSFLDIGAWDGYFTFLAEDRGAAHVTSVDYCCWGGREYGVPEKKTEDWQKDGQGFCCPADGTTYRLAHAARKSKAKAVRLNVYDLRPELVGGQHDVVLFAGVLYHLRFPFLGLTRAASVTRKMLILETTIASKVESPDLVDTPMLVFYPGKEFGNDPTNWFNFNVASLTAMLRVLGFSRIDVVYRRPNIEYPRVVIHAFR